MKKSKCDYDCFNCKFDDCIDNSNRSPYEKVHRVKKNGAIADRKERKRQNAKEYYKRHRKECIQRSLDNYYKNRDEILRKKRERLNAGKSIE